MLKEMQFVEVDKVEVAMNRLRLHEAEALRRNPKGYYVAFSGGKVFGVFVITYSVNITYNAG